MSNKAKVESSYIGRTYSRSRSTITLSSYADSVQLTVEKDGKLAWLACFCAFVDQVFVCGLMVIFGVFFVEFVRDFNSTRSQAAWLGALAYGIMKLFGLVTGLFVMRFNNRAALMLGCFLCSVSTLVSSFIVSMEVLYVTYSVMYGIGASLVINCVMVLANSYFDKHLGFATGLVCSGSSIGALVLAPLSHFIIQTFGWRMAFRFFSATFVCVGFLNCCVKPIKRKRKGDYEQDKNNTIENEMSFEAKVSKRPSLFRNRAFILWVIGTAFGMFGYLVPFVHLVSYGVTNGIPVSKCTYFVMVLSGATTIGRLVSGRIVQKGYLNSLHFIQLCMIVIGVLFMILPTITSFAGLLPFIAFLGLVDGCYVVLLPMVTCSLVDYNDAILAWGMLAGTCSLSVTIGPPAAGALFDIYGNYNIAFHAAGAPVICGALILFFIPWAKKTSPSSTNTLNFDKSAENVIDSGKGSDERLHGEASEETLQLNYLRDRGYFLPSGKVNSNVQYYLDTHLSSKFDPTASTSLNEYQNSIRSYPIDMQSESSGVSLALVSGPDGMPISVPSSILVPHSRSTTKSSSTRISGSSQKRPKTPKYVDAGTQFGGIKDTVSEVCRELQSTQHSDWSIRNGATPTSGANSCVDNKAAEQKSSCVQTDNSVKSGLLSVTSIKEGEDQDVFKNIFKDTSDTSV